MQCRTASSWLVNPCGILNYSEGARTHGVQRPSQIVLSSRQPLMKGLRPVFVCMHIMGKTGTPRHARSMPQSTSPFLIFHWGREATVPLNGGAPAKLKDVKLKDVKLQYRVPAHLSGKMPNTEKQLKNRRRLPAAPWWMRKRHAVQQGR